MIPKFGMVLNQDYTVRRDVFERALSQCNQSSMPGYPLSHYAQTVAACPPDLIYQGVNHLVRRWIDPSIVEALVKIEGRRAKAAYLFMRGFTHPSTAFVKGEPTKKDKIARNIFGVSICMNVLGRILFGDYLNGVVETWGDCEHKVGLDFNTLDGLKTLKGFVTKMFDENPGIPFVSDDVQGWEYMDRGWMHSTWHKTFLANGRRNSSGNKLDPVIERLYKGYCLAELYAPTMFSDGRLLIDPFYFCKSGRLTTHLQNSDSRAALGLACSPHFKRKGQLLCMTNGDDYVGARGEQKAYERLGFVITDCTAQTRDLIKFCSQVFYFRYNHLSRHPEGLAKLFANAILSPTDDIFRAVLLNAEQHPGYGAFLEICTYWRAVIKQKACALENDKE